MWRWRVVAQQVSLRAAAFLVINDWSRYDKSVAILVVVSCSFSCIREYFRLSPRFDLEGFVSFFFPCPKERKTPWTFSFIYSYPFNFLVSLACSPGKWWVLRDFFATRRNPRSRKTFAFCETINERIVGRSRPFAVPCLSSSKLRAVDEV
jgi:hypothetical protein